jgi:hypothetical protein
MLILTQTSSDAPKKCDFKAIFYTETRQFGGVVFPGSLSSSLPPSLPLRYGAGQRPNYPARILIVLWLYWD